MSLDNFLLKYSRFIDNVDMYLGPVSSITRQTGEPFLEGVSAVTKTFDIGIKVPFVVLYVARTKDFASVPYFATKEIFAATIPYGGFIEIFRTYERAVRKNVKKKA